MEYSEIFKGKGFSIAIPMEINNKLISQLLRKDKQEDLVFALWIQSEGKERYTALINEVIYPEKKDRSVHGNVSFNYKYLIRVCSLAMKKNCGVALLHSHIGPGWQDMSFDDIGTERKTFINVDTTTDRPFVGLTLGTDGTWSGRIWYYSYENIVKHNWAFSVRVTGPSFKIYFNDRIISPRKVNTKTLRTVNIWGDQVHRDLTRLKIGIVGLGSVGSVVAEILARMGMASITLIDFDKVEDHNLDRSLGVYKEDIGKRKVDAVKRSIEKSATSDKIEILAIHDSIANEKGYRSALDCDILFCCVDKPRPRYILNHIAYAHLIPVIDGGILIEFDENRNLNFADWTVHTISPGMPCLHCLGAYHSSDVELEKSGKLKDSLYMQGLPDTHYLKSRENLSPFSMNLASMEIMHFIVLCTDLVDPAYYGEQKYRFKHGFLSRNYDVKCNKSCDFQNNIGMGDTIFELFDKG